MAKKAVKKTKTVKKTAQAKKQTVQRVKTVSVKAKPAPEKAPVRGKGYSKAELEHFRQIIMEKRKEILEELEALRATIMDSTTGEYTQENSAYSLHMEQGTDTMEREKTFLFASREGKFLNYLDDALKRIDKGDYGFCNDCGKLIEKERLEAVPHAQLCVDCKMKRGK
ncbi:MAG: TraR/DksA C4-type zinc finger protein [Ignavibacterium sp.]|jgi:RNA polymerase-binding protein DksA